MRGNMNPEQMKQAMQRLGIDQEELQADHVEIHLGDKVLRFDNPSVQKVNMMGQETYQVMGSPAEHTSESRDVSIDEDDIRTIMEQTGCDEQQAREALQAEDFDIAAAVMRINDE